MALIFHDLIGWPLSGLRGHSVSLLQNIQGFQLVDEFSGDLDLLLFGRPCYPLKPLPKGAEGVVQGLDPAGPTGWMGLRNCPHSV